MSACSKRMLDYFPLATVSSSVLQDVYTALDKRFFLTVEMSNSNPCHVQPKQHPWKLYLAAKVGRFALFWDMSLLQVQRSKITFHSSWEQQHTHTHTHAMFKTLQWTQHEPDHAVKRSSEMHTHQNKFPKHLPCLIGSVTFSGLSCLPYLPDVMEREGRAEWKQPRCLK